MAQVLIRYSLQQQVQTLSPAGKFRFV